MADICEADNTDCLSNLWPDDGEPGFGRPFQVWRNVGAFDEDGENDDGHAN